MKIHCKTSPEIGGMGHSLKRKEDARFLQGQGNYIDDIKLPDMLYMDIKRSPFAYAKIKSINSSKAEALAGVKAVITGKELPIKFGVLPISEDETAMAVDKTRYIGEIVVAIAADTEEIASEACKLIEIDFSPLRPFFNLVESCDDVGDS